MFGVGFRLPHSVRNIMILSWSLTQTRMLHVSDPKALYTILIKDGDLFPKTIEPISCVAYIHVTSNNPR